MAIAIAIAIIAELFLNGPVSAGAIFSIWLSLRVLQWKPRLQRHSVAGERLRALLCCGEGRRGQRLRAQVEKAMEKVIETGEERAVADPFFKGRRSSMLQQDVLGR